MWSRVQCTGTRGQEDKGITARVLPLPLTPVPTYSTMCCPLIHPRGRASNSLIIRIGSAVYPPRNGNREFKYRVIFSSWSQHSTSIWMRGTGDRVACPAFRHPPGDSPLRTVYCCIYTHRRSHHFASGSIPFDNRRPRSRRALEDFSASTG